MSFRVMLTNPACPLKDAIRRDCEEALRRDVPEIGDVRLEFGTRVGILDADIYGPNIPSMLGVDEPPARSGEKLVPVEKHGIQMMSMGFLIPPNQALVWRGPMIHSAINQLITQVEWDEMDYLMVDLAHVIDHHP